jgi:tetratricopeptide (TPR) repeat protein
MKTCAKCGAQFPDFINICTKCKNKIDSSIGSQPSSQQPQIKPEKISTTSISQEKPNNYNLTYVGLIIVVLLAGFYFFKSDNSDKSIKTQSLKLETNINKKESNIVNRQVPLQQTELQSRTPPQGGVQSSNQAQSNLIERALSCTIENCVEVLFLAVQPRNVEAISLAASRVSQLNRAQTGNRTVARDLNAKGLAQLRTGNVESAINLFANAAQADPNDAEIMGNLGYALVQSGRIEEADKILTSAIYINPKRTATWGAVGEFFVKKNQVEAAIRSFLLGYEFSSNREKTLQFYSETAANPDKSELRPTLNEVIRRIQTNYF